MAFAAVKARLVPDLRWREGQSALVGYEGWEESDSDYRSAGQHLLGGEHGATAAWAPLALWCLDRARVRTNQPVLLQLTEITFEIHA